MGDKPQCSSCGADLAPDAVAQGLCAACLLKLGLSSTNIPAAEPVRPPVAEPASHPSRRRVSAKFLAIIGAGIVTAAFLVTLAVFLFPRSRPEQFNVVRFGVYLAKTDGEFAVSPDGRKLVLAAEHEPGKTVLMVRSFDSFTEQPLTGTEDARSPFWSPDSRYVGFFSRGKLKKVDIGIGSVEVLCDAPSGRDGTWSKDGMIVFARNSSGGLFRISG